MPQVSIGPDKSGGVDGSVAGAVLTFLQKLGRDDTSPGLHIEPVVGGADHRLYTGRVTKFWRALLAKVGDGPSATYVYFGTFQHDEAYEKAKRLKLTVNPQANVLELVEAAAPPTILENVPRFTQPEYVAPPPFPTPTLPEPVLRARGYSVHDLLELGIDDTLASDAILQTDELELVALTDDAPARWQQNVLLELADGVPLHEIKARYGLEKVQGDPDSDSVVLAALDRPASRMDFALVTDDAELRAALEDPDFGRWRTFLHPEQRAYAYGERSGSFRLSGGAGTGKTVVLLHRARHLQRENPQARIVLTTYNKTLASSLRDSLLFLDPQTHLAKYPGDVGIFVGTVDAIAWRLVTQGAAHGLPITDAAGLVLGTARSTVVQATTGDAWRRALSHAGHELPESLRTPGFFAAEYGTVVVPHRITTRDEYLAAPRAGRRVPLDRERRSLVWDVIDAYREAGIQSRTTDYDEKSMIAAIALDQAAPTIGRPVDHVLVDEAQDLSPSRLILLRALVADGPGDLLLAEDAQQRIYAPLVVLSRYGILIRGRSRRLTLNYRTTAQTLRFASSILAGEELIDFDGEPTQDDGARSARVGLAPRTEGASSLDGAYATAALTLLSWINDGATPESLAVLVRGGNEGTYLLPELADRGVTATYIGPRDTPSKGAVSVMTMHRSKGMEFRHVLLFGVTAEALPAHVDDLPEPERNDAVQRERSLLYVATTRARDELVVLWDGEPSELLPLAV
ncbi:3'-5' exonuclease [Oerskovia merdavium]|uniref:DNA 3'-5' helicase n=1 Tax=Oerskovia merdavium TaxID=2762227 RepID=A0ABR8TYV0_9CELL|nr:3'-5' exonuclease [Oerskovia merdavium]MBD7980966.1 AAA family ATPase [Oerskovia merdavium]